MFTMKTIKKILEYITAFFLEQVVLRILMIVFGLIVTITAIISPSHCMVATKEAAKHL